MLNFVLFVLYMRSFVYNSNMKHKGWNTTLFSLVFIATPAIIGYAFLLPDWTQKQVVNYGYLWLIGLAFLVYAVLISYFFIFLRVLYYDSLIFSIPLAFVFFLIFISPQLPWWARALIVFGGIFITIPISIMVQKFHKKEL